MSHEDFVRHWNYMCQGSEPQDADVLQELMHLITGMMKDQCGTTVNFEIINNIGEIKLIGEEDETLGNA